MADAWKVEKSSPHLSLRALLLYVPAALLLFLFLFFFFSSSPSSSSSSLELFYSRDAIPGPNPGFRTPIPPFDCRRCPQATPVFAGHAEDPRRPFIYSIADLGSLPKNPQINIVRMLHGRPFWRPDISATVQEVLDGMKEKMEGGLVVDVGANVGMASFAAAAMGRRVLAFEPVFENLQKLCDGVFLNRAWDRVTVFAAAASDQHRNITFHKLVGRMDNSAVSATGAKMSFKSNEVVAMEVPSIPLDDIIPDSEDVVLVKIDVQGWEYHVLQGAKKVLSREPGRAPYLIYEEDESLLRASNTSSGEIRRFLSTLGYERCTRRDGDAHCTKDK